MLDVVYEGARSIGPVPHEGAARGRLGIDPDAFHIDPVAAQAIEIDPPEVIVPHATDDGGRLAELRGLVDEDRRRAGRKGANQADRFAKSVALVGRHDLDEDLADREDRFHRSAHPVAAVDIVGLRHDVVGVFACEECREAANLVGARHASERHRRADDALLLARLQVLVLGEHRVDVIPVLVVDDARRDAVHVDAVLDEIQARALR